MAGNQWYANDRTIMISVEEALNLLSKVRLGISIQAIKETTLENITSLMLDVQDNSLQLIFTFLFYLHFQI